MFVIELTIAGDKYECSIDNKSIVKKINEFDEDEKLKIIKGIELNSNKEKISYILKLMNELKKEDLTLFDLATLKNKVLKLIE